MLDALAWIFGILFQIPSKRLDNLMGVEEEDFSSLVNVPVSVTEEITSSSGKVKYSGTIWKARLSNHEAIAIPSGSEAYIVATDGNTLIVASVK